MSVGIGCDSSNNLKTYSRHCGHGCFFLGTHFLKKRVFSLLAPPKQVPSLTISNENSFFKTQGTRLGVVVISNKGLE